MIVMKEPWYDHSDSRALGAGAWQQLPSPVAHVEQSVFMPTHVARVCTTYAQESPPTNILTGSYDSNRTRRP
jgi:hypothetical protein